MKWLWLAKAVLLSLGAVPSWASTPGSDRGGVLVSMPAYDAQRVCHKPDNADCIAAQRGYQRLVIGIWPQIAAPVRRQCVTVNVWNDYIRLYQCLVHAK